MRKSTKHFCIIIVVCFIIQPFLLQNAYTSQTFDELGVTFLDAAEASTAVGYVNTSGNFMTTAALSDSDTGDGEVTSGPTTLVAQDLDEYADIQSSWVVASTIWNASCFSTATMEDPVVAIGIRVYRVGGDENVLMEIYAGWQGAAYQYMLIPQGRYITTSEDDLTYFHLSATQIADIEEVETYLAASGIMFFRFIERDADEILTGASYEIEIHLYTGTGTEVFFTYLLYMGALNFLIALGMTQIWNPTASRGRRYRPRRRRRR